MNKYHQKNIKAYDEKATNYNNTLDGRLTEKFKNLLVDNILASVDKNSSHAVLDVGCGNGTLLTKLSKVMRIAGFGVDLSPQMIANAKIRNPEFDFIASGCESIPFSSSSMDIITVCSAYHHFPDVNKFANEANRLLKTGGRLYIADINLPIIIRQLVNLMLPLSKDGDVRIYSKKEILETFQAKGFRFVDISKNGHIQIVQFQRSDD
jgi:ubiquinone/menaquinone biosynthesis C-methylase UbiE